MLAVMQNNGDEQRRIPLFGGLSHPFSLALGMLMPHLQTPGIVFRESLMAAITQTSMGMLSVWIKTYQDTIPRVWLGVLGLHVYPSYTIPK